MHMIDDVDIFNKFHKYTYLDIKEEDSVVNDLCINAISSRECRTILANYDELTYLTSVLEYISYKSIPIKEKYNLYNIIGSGNIEQESINCTLVKLNILYYKNTNTFYERKYTIYTRGRNVNEIVYPTFPTIINGDKKYTLY